MSFLHGVEVVQINSGPRPIETASASVIGLVGTAPKGPVNIPTLVNSYGDAVAQFGGADGTLPDALKGLFAQENAAVVVVNVLDPAVHKTAVAPAAYTFNTITNKLEVADDYIYTPVVTNTGATVTYTEGTDYTYVMETGVFTRLTTGSITSGESVKIGYDKPNEAAITDVDIIGTVDAGTGAYTGAQALLGAESRIGVRPRLIAAPGYTSSVTLTVGAVTAAPVTTGMLPVAEKLRGWLIAEGPNTNDANAIEYRNLFGSERVLVVDPWVKVLDAVGDIVAQPNSGHIVGAIAYNDRVNGWWTSPSNTVIKNILGTTRDIDFVMGEASSRANILNANEVATIIRQQGYRLWGNRTCSADPFWAMFSHVRLNDIILDSLQAAHLWAVDKNITANYVEAVTGGVNAFLAGLAARQIISGGTCWADPSLNTKTAMDGGEVYFNFDYGRYGVAEHVQFRAAVNNDYTVKSVFG